MINMEMEKYSVAGVLRVTSDEVRDDAFGRLTEQPILVNKLEKLVRSLHSLLFPAQLKLGPILIKKGGYEVDILGAEGMLNPEDVLQGLLDQLERDSSVVNCNARLESPANMEASGLSRQSLIVLNAQNEILELGLGVEVSRPCGSTRAFSALEPRAISAMQSCAGSALAERKVHGEITGVLRGHGNSVRIEINRTAIFSVPNLSVDDAWALFQRRDHIFGVSRRREKEDVIDTYHTVHQPDLICTEPESQ